MTPRCVCGHTVDQHANIGGCGACRACSCEKFFDPEHEAGRKALLEATEEMGKRCPFCLSLMHHYRLRGYRCPHCQ